MELEHHDYSFFCFDKHNSFCISLFDRNDRWEKVNARFLHFGLELTRFRASIPDDISELSRFHNSLNIGQKCCAYSHIRLWRHIWESGLDCALIVEDDACLHRNWLHKLAEFQENDWDAIFLNASEPITPAFTWMPANEQFLTGGYIVSRRGIERLLSMFTTEYHSADWMTSRLQTFGRCYSYFPWLIIQEGIESTIGSGCAEDHAKVLRCLAEIDYDITENYIIDI